MTPYERSIYLLRPQEYPPELIAVAFAKTSRSPESFLEIAQGLNETSSSEFHEKWVIGYGHASVAEHAVLHLAAENVSRLAVETIESSRLASYTEKSTRYQKWESDRFHVPDEIQGTRFADLYAGTCQMLFSTYEDVQDPVRAVVAKKHPRREGESMEQWDRRIRSRYIDSCRFLLPAASLANVGITINARNLEHAISKMLTNPLAEVRMIGEEIREAALEEVPTLLKYTGESSYMAGIRQALREIVLPGFSGTDEMVRLVYVDEKAEEQVLAAGLFEQCSMPLGAVQEYISGLSPEEKADLAGVLLGGRGKFDAPPRALEHAVYTFEAVMDQGAYFEIKRHRMMTQSPQPLTVEHGFAVPRLLTEAGVEGRYRDAMEKAAAAVQRIAVWNPDAASYLVPNGFNRRVLMTLNLRELFHLCELRAAPNAHFSVRRIAYRMAELAKEAHPLLASYLRLPSGETWESIDVESFTDNGLR